MTAISQILSISIPVVTPDAVIAGTEMETSFEAIFENAHLATAEGKSAPTLPNVKLQNVPADGAVKPATLLLPPSSPVMMSPPDKTGKADKKEKTEKADPAQPQALPIERPQIVVSLPLQAAPVVLAAPAATPAQAAPTAATAPTAPAKPAAPKCADYPSAQPTPSAPAIADVAASQKPAAQAVSASPIMQSDVKRPNLPVQEPAERTFAEQPAIQKNAEKPTAAVQVKDAAVVAAKPEQPRIAKAELQVERATPPHSPSTENIAPSPMTAAPQPVQPALIVTPAATPAAMPTGPELQLDLSKGDIWLDQLAREIVAVAGDGGKLRFSLTPEALGQLEVRIEHNPDGVLIDLRPTTDAAKQIIAIEQPRLNEELRQSGVRVSNGEFTGTGTGQGTAHRDSAAQYQPPQRPTPLLPSQRTASHPVPTRRQGRFA